MYGGGSGSNFHARTALASTLGPSYPDLLVQRDSDSSSESDFSDEEDLEPFQHMEYQREKTQRLLPPAPVPKNTLLPGTLAPPLRPDHTRPPGGLFTPTTESNAEDPVRTTGLGQFAILRDSLVARICRLSDRHTVLTLGATSRAFYQIANWDAKIWKSLALTRWCGDFIFRVNWKLTAFYSHKGADLPPPELVKLVKTQLSMPPPPPTPEYAKPNISVEDAKAIENNPYAKLALQAFMSLAKNSTTSSATSNESQKVSSGETADSNSNEGEKGANSANPNEIGKSEASAQLNGTNGVEKEYIRIPGFYSAVMYKEWYLSQVELDGWYHDTGNVPRIRANEFTAERFREKFLKPGMPCIITDVVATWPAMQKWHPDLLMNEYCETLIKVNEYTEDELRVKMTMRDFLIYMRENNEYKPLYVFDSSFQRRAPGLLQDFGIPRYFWEDLFAALDESHRPAFRWFLMGSARTGSPFHQDPNGTSAWNAVTHGHKRWALYPPWMQQVPGSFESGRQLNSLKWWTLVYPHLPPQEKPIEFIQNPGDLIFIPSGWWHAVLNLDETVSVTQNFVNMDNLDAVVHSLFHGEMQKVLPYWRQRLMSLRPELYDYIGNRIAYETSIAQTERVETLETQLHDLELQHKKKETKLNSEILRLRELLNDLGVPAETITQTPAGALQSPGIAKHNVSTSAYLSRLVGKPKHSAAPSAHQPSENGVNLVTTDIIA